MYMNNTGNILTDFKRTLGYTNATNQYVELCCRAFCKEHSDVIIERTMLREYAESYGLNLSDLTGEKVFHISNNYIVNVHASFMVFLNNFKNLDGSPTKSAKSRAENQSLLDWVLSAVYKNQRSDEVNMLYDVCNFYRLVRNLSVHKGNNTKEYCAAMAKLQKDRKGTSLNNLVGRLAAPNDIEHISFDDQVLFSKVANQLAERIYLDAEYDYAAYIDANKDKINTMIGPYLNNPMRAKQKVYNCMLRIYPLSEKAYEVIGGIVEEKFLRDMGH